MNVTIIPFHDWRKNEKEGFRTRDAHFIKAFITSQEVDKLLVVNRPTTLLELLYKKHSKKLNGKLIYKKENFFLYEVANNTYVVDWISNDIFNQVLKRQKWFINVYNKASYISFIKECWEFLNFTTPTLLSQNIFSYKLTCALPASRKVFDAWDNFLKFPAYNSINTDLKAGYHALSKESIPWVTNSLENISFFKTNFNVKKISLLKNGVNTNFVKEEKVQPRELDKIKRPIVGFGGKISYLLNVDLINFLTKDNPQCSFVFVGQILDSKVYNSIKKHNNVFFLGDKHYDDYPDYVLNFDVCIIPYNIGKKQHGGDSIKAYEYLATGKKVVGTKGNGLEDLEDFIYLCNTPEAFSKELKSLENHKPILNISDYSWANKSKHLIDILSGRHTENDIEIRKV